MTKHRDALVYHECPRCGAGEGESCRSLRTEEGENLYWIQSIHKGRRKVLSRRGGRQPPPIIQSLCLVCGRPVADFRVRRLCQECGKSKRLASMVLGACHRGLAWELTAAQAMQLCAAKCTYCGLDGGGIDRIDSSIGYTPTNTTPCCTACNLMKLDHDVDEWMDRMRLILSRHRKGFNRQTELRLPAKRSS